MQNRGGFLRLVLLTNGIVDLLTITQVLLPLMVGFVFGASYLVCAVRWRRSNR